MQTYFRFTVFDAATRTLVERTAMALLPALQHRDGPKIALIQAADSATAVLDLLPLATGIAETIWDQQLRRFGDAGQQSVRGPAGQAVARIPHQR